MYKIEELIDRANDIHGKKYTYDISTYNKVSEKMKIICPEHGEFWQSLHQHINKKQGCPLCGNIAKTNKKRYTSEQFIKEAHKIHGDKYDYSKVEYVDSQTKVCIVCPKHGEFFMIPSIHLRGCSCPKCANKKRGKSDDKETFIDKARKVHGDKYDYSKVEYINQSTKVCIICHEHGEFWQIPAMHLTGQGCPKCAGRSKTSEDIINDFKKVHGDKYDYSKVEYKYAHEKVCIICPEHGEFWQLPFDHLDGHGCQKCGLLISNSENEISDFIKKYLDNEPLILHNRTIIKPYEIDLYLPSRKIAIEYNGIKWHSEEFGKDKYYHLNKLNGCKEKNIKLIHIFDDEYLHNKELVRNKILHILNLKINSTKIYGRKTIIKEIAFEEYKPFMDLYHIQGSIPSTVYLGAYYEDKLIAAMSFVKRSEIQWELNRFASDYNYEYTYYVVYTLDKDMYEKQIAQAMDDVEDNDDQTSFLKDVLSDKLKSTILLPEQEDISFSLVNVIPYDEYDFDAK